MIHIYYGNGKGKTTAAIGAAIRAAGSGMNVMILQFLKNGDSSECCILKNINGITFKFSDKYFGLYDEINEDSFKALKLSYNNLLSDAIESISDYQMIVLDEILDAVNMDLISNNLLNKLLSIDTAEIIMTGHKKISEIAEKADYISEIKMEKHPFFSNKEARKGIEY